MVNTNFRNNNPVNIFILMKNKKLDRYRGCFIGLALGDSLGAPIEFAKPGFVPITDLRASLTHGLTKGEWTDDTAMALATATSILAKQTMDLPDQLARYLSWYKKGHYSSSGRCVGIGRTTRESLEDFRMTGGIVAIQSNPELAGNGSIMRMAPIPMFATNIAEAGNMAMMNSLTTHSNLKCTDAAQIFSSMIFLALKGKSKAQIFAAMKKKKKITKEVADIFKFETYKCNPPFIKSTGYVIDSLQAALWAFNKSRSFKHGVLLAVNLGGDADTIGALYGQLAGAFYGYDSIPKHWKKNLVKHNVLLSTSEELFNTNKLRNARNRKEVPVKKRS